jgi:hypothetical protein
MGLVLAVKRIDMYFKKINSGLYFGGERVKFSINYMIDDFKFWKSYNWIIGKGKSCVTGRKFFAISLPVVGISITL